MQILSPSEARALWLKAQGLHEITPFGKGAAATPKAIEHLGYVQIDTIHVIERSHHHILFTRIPDYKRVHLENAQSKNKSVFEYWTHALSYIPSQDYRYFLPRMNAYKKNPGDYFGAVAPADWQKVWKLLKEGPISIRDINDDELVEKNHPWASRKPSKRALQWGFYSGRLVVSERHGMLKKYDIAARHFAWDKKPRAATDKEVVEYKINRALRSQGFVSVDSICYLEKKETKAAVHRRLEKRAAQGDLVRLQIPDVARTDFWARPEALAEIPEVADLVHILSPFDPIIIQRKRFHQIFGYDHRFEAYVPKEKRKYGYFALPVLRGDQVVAVLDLKTDREKGKLLVQQWSWLPRMRSAENKKRLEEELHRFEKFQLQ